MIHSKKISFSILTIMFITLFSIFALTQSTTAADKNDTKTSKCKIAADVNSFYDKDQIENELKTQEGVSEVYLDLDEHIVYITYSYPVTNSDKLCKVIKNLGYEARVVEDSNKV